VKREFRESDRSETVKTIGKEGQATDAFGRG